MPATSTFMSAPSSGISGMGYSRISVVLGATRTAARTFSAKASSRDVHCEVASTPERRCAIWRWAAGSRRLDGVLLRWGSHASYKPDDDVVWVRRHRCDML